jgi:hypothetical protein
MRYVIESQQDIRGVTSFVAYRATPYFEKAGQGESPLHALHALMRFLAEADQPYEEPPVDLLMLDENDQVLKASRGLAPHERWPSEHA